MFYGLRLLLLKKYRRLLGSASSSACKAAMEREVVDKIRRV
jgi:hypothetical protein